MLTQFAFLSIIVNLDRISIYECYFILRYVHEYVNDLILFHFKLNVYFQTNSSTKS